MKTQFWFRMLLSVTSFLLLVIGVEAASPKSDIEMRVYQVKHILNNKLVKRRLNLLKYDSSKIVPAFSVAGNLKRGDLVSFELHTKNPDLSYCLIGVDARNNYHNYGSFLKDSVNNNLLKIPADSKALQLDDNGTEHFVIIVSNKPLGDAFFKSLQGIEMTFNKQFYHRVETQLRSKLCKTVSSKTEEGFSYAAISFKDTANKKAPANLPGDSILAISVDVTVRMVKPGEADSVEKYKALIKTYLDQKNYERSLYYAGKTITQDPFNKDYYKSRVMILANMPPGSAYFPLIKNDLHVMNYLETERQISPMIWYTDLLLDGQKAESDNKRFERVNEVLKLTDGKSLYEFLETEPDAGKKAKVLYTALINCAGQTDMELVNYLINSDANYKKDPFIIAFCAVNNIDWTSYSPAAKASVLTAEKQVNEMLANKQSFNTETNLFLQNFYHRLYHYYTSEFSSKATGDAYNSALRALENGFSLGNNNRELAQDYFNFKEVMFIKSGDYKQALETANSWIKVLPDSADAYFSRAFVNLNLNHLDTIDDDCQNGYSLSMMGFNR
jgi:tetratricopeptide (TPR) repeat protein